MCKIKGRLILKGILKNESPFVIGKGKGDLIDIEILKGEKGMPYIPATSFIGVLKHHICNEKFDIEDEYTWNYFWGDNVKENDNDSNTGIQSHFMVSDIKLEEEQTGILAIRDGIAIDSRYGVAKEKAKYDYEVVNKNLTWGFCAELILREGVNENLFFKILNTVLNELKQGRVRIGAFTTKGFGKFRLVDCNVYLFVFPKDGEKYLKFLADEENALKELEEFDLSEYGTLQVKDSDDRDFELKAKFTLKSSILINSYGTNTEETGNKEQEDVDKIHIKYNGEPVLPGTSLKGAIKARCVKIINTLIDNKNYILPDKIESLLNDLFGFVDNEGKTKRKQKSRLIVEESIIEGAEESEQTRIKIDRFTGGVIEGALVKSKPVWHKNEEVEMCIKIEKAKEWEIGLILLVLKDLWSEDLPIGGEKSIGRGLLSGKLAQIKYGNKEYIIKQNGRKLEIQGNKAELENFVEQLLKEMGV